MAYFVKMTKEIEGIVDETYVKRNEADEARQREYESVVHVQAWFRGTQCRAYFKHLNKSATAVQRAWRGFLGRRYYRHMLKNQVFTMKLNHYNAMATAIQKMWRGYYTRKYIFNYYSRKRYLEGLQVKNEQIREQLADYKEQQDQFRQWRAEEAADKQLTELAQKTHHLISTEVIPGIYNSPYQPFPSEMEFHLRNARPRTHKKKIKDRATIYDPTPKRYDIPVPCPLPPIHAKPKGPFRDPKVVINQRYKQFQPSLRVATTYMAVEEAREKFKQEEWVARLHDNIFVPFTTKERHYDPLLHTTSQYGHLKYGNHYFREEQLDKHILPQNFQTVVPPIPVFDKLNDTYSQGQV